jgi:hypothetical protein
LKGDWKMEEQVSIPILFSTLKAKKKKFQYPNHRPSPAVSNNPSDTFSSPQDTR